MLDGMQSHHHHRTTGMHTASQYSTIIKTFPNHVYFRSNYVITGITLEVIYTVAEEITCVNVSVI